MACLFSAKSDHIPVCASPELEMHWEKWLSGDSHQGERACRMTS